MSYAAQDSNAAPDGASRRGNKARWLVCLGNQNAALAGVSSRVYEMTLPAAEDNRLIILMPVYNDWKAVGMLCQKIDQVLAAHNLSAAVIAIDDGSTVTHDQPLGPGPLLALQRVEVLELRRNLGHQRAICVGLCHVHAQGLSLPLVIMDSDGEDAPEDIPRLLERYRAEHGRKVVFAARAKRSEGLVFRLGYLLFRLVHLLLTGRAVRVGNFSILPPSAVASLVTSPDLWSHYAAAVFSSRIPSCSLPTQRAKRLDGSSRMNFVALVVHGLVAISVFSDVVGVRLLLACMGLGLLTLSGIAAVVSVRLCTSLAIPGWATYSVGLLALLLLQSMLLAACFSFLILSGRNRAAFLPSRDYVHFLGRRDVVGCQTAATEPPA